MTEEQKDLLIAKMLDAPSSLSDEELEAILSDEELRDIYEASAALSTACIRQPELDMEAEWKNFRPRIRRKPSAMRWVMRTASIFLGVIVLSGIAGRIIDYIFTNDSAPVTAEANLSPELNDTPMLSPDTPLAEEITATVSKPAIAKAQPVAPSSHLAKAKITKPEKSSVKMDKGMEQMDKEIDVDEYLRIQQARIDNDLALQAAEDYIAEFEEIMPLLDAAGVYNPELENAIRKVTME
jgi:hypothetical protein